MKYPNVTEGDLLPDQVKINLNMLCPLMLHRIAREVNSTDVITIDQGGTMRRVAKLGKQLAEPSSFSNTICHITILGLCTRPGDCLLMLGGPGHQIVPKEHCVTGGGTSSVRTAGPVSISVDDQLRRW